VVCGREGFQLQSSVSSFYYLPGGGVELLRGALDAVPAVGVCFDLLAHRPAEEVVYRLVHGLADYVPAGHLEDGHARAQHFSRAREVVAAQLLDQLLYTERVVADDVPRSGL